MNFIKISKEEYEIQPDRFENQYVVVDNNLIYNKEIVGKVDIKMRRHQGVPYNFSFVPHFSSNTLANIIKVEEEKNETENEETPMDLDGTILIEEEEN